MPQLLKIPREVEKVLGSDASDKLYEFLNQAFDEQKNRVLERSDDKFSKQLLITESKLEKQISALRVEMNEKFSDIHKQFSDIHKQFSDTHKQISDIHKQIAIQTKWILIAILGAVVLFPIINRIVQKLLP